MTEQESLALVRVDSNMKIVPHKVEQALPTEYLTENPFVSNVETGGYKRLFSSFYELNNSNEIDPVTRKTIKSKGTFTRYTDANGSKTELFSTVEVWFIPLYFQIGRLYYSKEYKKGETNKSAPDCQSQNGIVPLHNRIANSCGECEFSKWRGNSPPKCGETPELLALDLTGAKLPDDHPAKALAARDAFTVKFGKSAIKAFKELVKLTKEPRLITSANGEQICKPIDLQNYIIKMTAQIVYDQQTGQESTYCEPVFEHVGYAPKSLSEELIKQLTAPVPALGNESPLQRFIGNTKPFESKETETSRTEAMATSVKDESVTLKTEVDISIPAQQILDVPTQSSPPKRPKVVAPTLHEMSDDDELSF